MPYLTRQRGRYRDFETQAISCVSVWNSSSGHSAAAKQAAIEKAARDGYDYVRLSAELYEIAPNRATRNWTRLDENLSIVAATGIGLLLGMTEGVQNGDWDCTNKKSYANFSVADEPYYRPLLVDVIARAVVHHGIPLYKIAATNLNEPDNTNFGASVAGVMTAVHIRVANIIAQTLRSAFPDLVLVGPSFSEKSDTNSKLWTVFDTETNFMHTAASGRPHAFIELSDYMDLHLYPNDDGRVPGPGYNDVYHHTRYLIRNWYEQAEELADGYGAAGLALLSKPLIVSETGRRYYDGQNTGPWEYGSDAELAHLQSAQIRCCRQSQDVHMYSLYRLQNESAGYDTRSSTSNFGHLRSTGEETLKVEAASLTNGRIYDSRGATAVKL